MKKCKYINSLFVFLVFSFAVHAQELSWIEIAPGAWKGVVGKPEAYDLIKASGASPNNEALTMALPLFHFCKMILPELSAMEKHCCVFRWKEKNNSMVLD